MPTIETKNLLLVTFTASAMEKVLNGVQEIEINGIKYTFSKGWPIDVYKNLFEYKIHRFREHPNEEEFEGVLIHKQQNLIIGDMGFKGGPTEQGSLEIGYSIAPSFQGRGFATEMGKAAIKWGFKQNGVKKIEATCSIYNKASIRVLEKIGMKKWKTDMEKHYWELANHSTRKNHFVNKQEG
ncbi:GNAT family N-acetyltransferase [Bacillus sp. RG28]|uniref:GNAT family N-acetyltransferase n=1 Tax=Gottfriedia endophytica TaxID=2820819 RepID=A0A940NED6_9BACI|nr:GNAT family N-acetyltransferase [Gottfriedia endophytica]MBP0723954.1 GNAT family N-acetyltransferase [Gottfriedia endophytica]